MFGIIHGNSCEPQKRFAKCTCKKPLRRDPRKRAYERCLIFYREHEKSRELTLTLLVAELFFEFAFLAFAEAFHLVWRHTGIELELAVFVRFVV